jgi:flagellar L-ring protein precursor FlgH
MVRPASVLAVLLAGIAFAGCSVVDRLSNIGEVPALSPLSNPTVAAGYRPVAMPTPEAEGTSAHANALWQTGSTSFFQDQRASKLGDILVVLININDLAAIQNQTERTHSGDQGFGVSGAIGTAIGGILPAGSSADALIGLSGNSSSGGSGSVNRTETIATVVAAMVIQVLPNGYLVVEGRQEVRVNFEVRELIVAGIVRPQDIAANNTIESSRIAELRMGYGGRGQISDVQQPSYGQQVLDALMPI